MLKTVSKRSCISGVMHAGDIFMEYMKPQTPVDLFEIASASLRLR